MRAPYAVLFLTACGSPLAPAPADEPAVRFDDRAPSPALMTTVSSVTASGPVELLGLTASGHPVVVVEGRVHELIGGALAARTLYAAAGDPLELGAVRAVAPRALGGAWVASSAGLFVLESGYLSHLELPLDAELRQVVEAPVGGALDGLWLATAAGLHRRTRAGRLEAVEAPLVSIAPGRDAALGVDTSGAAHLVEADGAAWYVSVPALDSPPITAVAASAGALWAGSRLGLYRWRAADEPAWTRLSLGGGAVLALAVDAARDRAWVRTPSGLVVVDGDALELLALPAPSGAAHLVVDDAGDAWLAEGAQLTRVVRGGGEAAVGFAADVAPWIEMHCARCHADFAAHERFSPRAEQALARVRSGDMPRCEGGLVCEEARLDVANHRVLESWIRQGKAR